MRLLRDDLPSAFYHVSPDPASGLRRRRGKRKAAKPPPKKAKPKVAQVFDCPFCGKSESCGVVMDLDHKIGKISCNACDASHSVQIHRLSDPIDVYAEWIDMCAPCHHSPVGSAHPQAAHATALWSGRRCEAVNNGEAEVVQPTRRDAGELEAEEEEYE